MKRDTNVTRKTGQKQPYFTPFCTVELILKPHIEILDNLWYQTILLGYLIGLRANLIVMGNWKSLYCPSAWLFSNYVRSKSSVQFGWIIFRSSLARQIEDVRLLATDAFAKRQTDRQKDRLTDRWKDSVKHKDG